jgi:hypothetical protein
MKESFSHLYKQQKNENSENANLMLIEFIKMYNTLNGQVSIPSAPNTLAKIKDGVILQKRLQKFRERKDKERMNPVTQDMNEKIYDLWDQTTEVANALAESSLYMLNNSELISTSLPKLISYLNIEPQISQNNTLSDAIRSICRNYKGRDTEQKTKIVNFLNAFLETVYETLDKQLAQIHSSI